VLDPHAADALEDRCEFAHGSLEKNTVYFSNDPNATLKIFIIGLNKTSFHKDYNPNFRKYIFRTIRTQHFKNILFEIFYILFGLNKTLLLVLKI